MVPLGAFVVVSGLWVGNGGSSEQCFRDRGPLVTLRPTRQSSDLEDVVGPVGLGIPRPLPGGAPRPHPGGA